MRTQLYQTLFVTLAILGFTAQAIRTVRTDYKSGQSKLVQRMSAAKEFATVATLG